MGHAELSRVTPDSEPEAGVLQSVMLRPPDGVRPHEVFEVFPGGRQLLVKLPVGAEVITAYYQADDHGILQPSGPPLAPVSFFTGSCMTGGLGVLLVLCFFTMLCVLPYVLLPALGLALLSIVPIIVFGIFVRFQFADSVRILQMVTSFFEAIAWFIPLVGIILVIYFPVGWQDWVSNCDVDVSTVDLSQIDTECLGKRAIQAYLMTAFLEELLKFLCVRRLLWFAFVTDSWALCCYGGAAGLGFAALENALYVGGGSLATALLRAGTAVPNHLMYGLLHGAFLSRRRFGHGGGRFSCCTSLLSPFLPMFLHGSHNFSIALCQYVNLRLGLAIMACVALTAVIILRLSMRNLEAQVNVQDLIDAKVLEAPACCFCCQGVCGWPVVWPPGAPVLAQLESEWCISHGLLRGLGNRTFELSDGGDKTQEAMVSTSLVGAATRNVFFETVIDQSTQDFRIGLRRGAETWTLSPAGFFHNNEQVEARPVSTECTIGCLLDWDASSLSFTEDGHELLSCTVDPAGPVGPAGPGQWILEWRAAGRLGIRLEHFQHSPEIDVQPLKQVSSQPGVGPVVGQVVGVILSESDE